MSNPNSIIRAEIQGVSQDLSVATGSFDMVNLGTVSAERLAEILAAMTRLSLPQADGDVCYPNLTVNGPQGATWFSIQDETGALFTENQDEPIGIAQAVEKVTGIPFTGIIPAHRSAGVAARPAPAVTAAVSASVAPPAASSPPKAGSVVSDPAALELIQLLNQPVGLAEFRRRFAYLQNGPNDPEFKRLVTIIEGSDLMPELKKRLTMMPPREWAIIHPGLGRRLFSFLLDIPIYIVFMAIGIMAIGVDENADPEVGAWYALWILLSFFIYFAGTEWVMSASPGRLLLGLRIANKKGGKPSIFLCVGRQFTRLFKFFLVFLTMRAAGNMRQTHSRAGMSGVAVGIGASGGGSVVRN
jgi:uncharacterized RDD family membrane protein YckC